MNDHEYFNIMRNINKIKGNIEELRIRLLEMRCLGNKTEMIYLQAKKLKVDIEMEQLNLRMMESRIAGHTPNYNDELRDL